MASAAVKHDPVPREPRMPCDLATTIRDECDRELTAWLGNTSENGFMAECEEKFPLGALVEIELPERGWVLGEVRWALGWRFGALIVHH